MGITIANKYHKNDCYFYILNERAQSRQIIKATGLGQTFE